MSSRPAMLAIPSPDLLVSLFASAAQVLGLFAVLFGGATVAKNRNAIAQGGGGSRARSPWPFRIVLFGFVALATGFLLYHFQVVDERNRRMQTNLVRSSREQGRAVGDANLKTRSFDEQETHPRGFTTDEVATWIAEGKPLNLIDVREDEEVEMGSIAGSWHRRYPDLRADPTGLEVPGKLTIMLCESGNRSSELCDEFTKLHRETHFMRGGYEKWLAEGRPMLGVDAKSRDDIRALPDFPNKQTLLDTDTVQRLFTEENAVFVDVRYPGEFATGSLPGAINLTLRKMLHAEIEPALRALPRRPIVAPCYDKRSSFYALILGCRLTRLGYDFRGRYSVPHEFSLPTKASVWVARWKAENANRSLFSGIEEGLAAALLWLRDRLGSLVLAILGLVLGVRALFLPVTFLAERDALRQHRLAPVLAEARARLARDPVRLRRASLEALRDAGIRPVRNLLGSLLQLVVFLALFAAVGVAAGQVTETFFGTSLGAPDGTFVLPVVCAVALAGMVLLQARTRRRSTWVLAVLVALLVGALVLSISIAAHLYLLLNIAFATSQTLAIRAWLERDPTKARPRQAPRAPRARLRDAAEAGWFGTKASRLAELSRAGLPVPDGVVFRADQLPSQTDLARALAELGTGPFAVRSSALCEDGSDQSFAGTFESILGVPAEGVAAAMSRVRDSFRAERATALGASGKEDGGILVQQMVPATRAGVLFTEDPASAGLLRVEFTDGLGEAVVGGKAKPESHCFTRLTHRHVGGTEPRLDLAPLIALGARIERIYGKPQDVEWAHADGRFWILQARDITRRAGTGRSTQDRVAAEQRRLLALVAGADADEVVFQLGEATELLPTPTPFSTALFESLWAAGGSVDLACRELGIRYDVSERSAPCYPSVFGRTYENVRETRRRMRRGLGALASFRLARSADAIERDTREDLLPAVMRECRLREAIDFGRLTTAELHTLFGEWLQGFVTRTYVRVEIVNLATEFYLEAATRRAKRQGQDAATLLGDAPESVVHKAFARLGAPEVDPALRAAHFLATFGFRAAHDFELSEPRYVERQELVGKLAANPAPEAAPATRPHATPKGLLAVAVQQARRFQVLKEEAKHAAMRELACLRRLLLELGQRHGLGALIFFLTPDEVDALQDESALGEVCVRARDRELARAELLRVEVQNRLRVGDLELLGVQDRAAVAAASAEGAPVTGIRVAGDREAIGHVRILQEGTEIDRLTRQDILVARFTDPCWTPAFRVVAGLVTEAGGWLSHAAIQARECNLPAIVGADGALSRLRDGELVRLCADGRVLAFDERRGQGRRAIRKPASWASEVERGSGFLVDIGSGGVRFAGVGTPGSPGTRVRIHAGEGEFDGRVAWCDASGFGVEFTTPLSAAELLSVSAA